MSEWYYPKGDMCLNCTKLHDNCSGLPFSTYPVAAPKKTVPELIRTDEGIPVICKMYVNRSNDER